MTAWTSDELTKIGTAQELRIVSLRPDGTLRNPVIVWVVRHGDDLTRSGIDVPTRELLTFSMLVALGGCDAQVKGHVAANITVGNDRTRLIDVVTQLLPFIGYPRTLNGLRAIDEVTAS